MAKRRTIGRDPLSSDSAPASYSAEIVPLSITPLAPVAWPESPEEPLRSNAPTPIVIDDRCRRIVGGRLEILGGALGVGDRSIWPFDGDERIGFIAPTGRQVDLCRELIGVRAWADRTEHRYLSAIGWGIVAASVVGSVGLLAVSGLRLLEPRRMIAAMELRDGTKLVARTDSVTVAGLLACANNSLYATA